MKRILVNVFIMLSLLTLLVWCQQSNQVPNTPSKNNKNNKNNNNTQVLHTDSNFDVVIGINKLNVLDECKKWPCSDVFSKMSDKQKKEFIKQYKNNYEIMRNITITDNKKLYKKAKTINDCLLIRITKLQNKCLKELVDNNTIVADKNLIKLIKWYLSAYSSWKLKKISFNPFYEIFNKCKLNRNNKHILQLIISQYSYRLSPDIVKKICYMAVWR